MGKSLYTTEKLADELNVSTSAIQEIRAKLKIKRFMTKDDYENIKNFVKEVRKYYPKVTLITINEYIER